MVGKGLPIHETAGGDLVRPYCRGFGHVSLAIHGISGEISPRLPRFSRFC